MKDFPNYLLKNNIEQTNLIKTEKVELTRQVVFQSKQGFTPSVVPSILKGIERTVAVDYDHIKNYLKREKNELILLDVVSNQTQSVSEDTNTQTPLPELSKKVMRRSGLHKGLDVLLDDATQNITYLTKRGDASHDE
ncbi:hypothetical protein KG089_01510 [Carnobacteriaceae bacterium zg-ZUI252]|nr:hypothetical protein [Carnobacteriaceae bacterium zg-ZUI252]